MGDDLTVAIVGLVGAVVGGGISFLGQDLIDRRSRRARKRSLAHAIASEMEAYLDLMERRGHVDYARDVIETNSKGAKRIPKNWISGFEKTANPFPVLHATLPEIGMLGSLSSDVARFYSRVTAVRATIMSADEGNFEEAHPSDLAHIFQQELDLWLTAVSDGRTTIKALRSV